MPQGVQPSTGGSATPEGPAGGSLWSTYPDPLVHEVRSNTTTAPVYVSATGAADGTLIGTFGATGLVMAASMALTMGTSGYIALPGATVAASGNIRAANAQVIIAASNGGAGTIPLLQSTGDTMILGGFPGPTQIQIHTSGTTGTSISTGNTIRFAVSSTFITASLPLVMATSTYIALPGTVATTGEIRGTFGTTLLATKNASLSADIPIISTGGSNTITFGGTNAASIVLAADDRLYFRATGTYRLIIDSTVATFSVPIALPGTVATAGDIRVAQTFNLTGLTSGSANMNVLSTTTGSITIGAATTGNSSILASNAFFVTIGGAGQLTAQNGFVTVHGYLIVGANPAASGLVRVTNNTLVLAADAAGAGDLALVATNNSDHAFFGQTAAGASQVVTAYINGSTSTVLRSNATDRLTVSTTLVSFTLPIALPGTVAATGDIRAANNTTIIAATTALLVDMPLLRTDASDSLILGSLSTVASMYLDAVSGYYFRLGALVPLSVSTVLATFTVTGGVVITPNAATAFAGIGSVRVANNVTAFAAATAGGGDMALVATNGSDHAFFGQTAAGASQVVTAYLNGSTSTVLRSNATDRLTVSTTTVTTTLPIVLPGAAPATTGDIRATKDRVVMACLDTDTVTNLPIIEVDAADGLILGDGSWASVKIEGPTGNTLTFDANNAIFTNPVEAATHFIVTNAGPRILAGTGSPESVVSAPAGSLYLNKSGGASTSAYVKESGSGNTGWKAVINA